ncbi:uncharacterized protein LOC128680303 [Plodia interpunctella]|uniref:uncharacterized protein LOC128680303 n=1 Tax=Plodia interpunctella TaxID=58824 RepID=UPI0023676F19|nr:uncharacterized protein LOC128680303 [Plodia interpunctella]
MKRNRILTRGQKLCNMVNCSNKNWQENEHSNSPVENYDMFLNQTSTSSCQDSGLRSIQESPLPVNFNDTEINAMVDVMINDEIFASPMHESMLTTDNFPDSSNIGTSHPSPSCSINHLEYDCDNNFCPYFIEKENLSLNLSLPEESSAQSGYSTPQANSPLSVLSDNSPHTSKNQRRRKDKGNLRERHVKEWIDVKRKTLRNLGKEYSSRRGVIRAARKMGPPCRCPKKCFEKLSEVERKIIFGNFWSLGDREKQWLYLTNLVTKKQKRRALTDIVSRRQYTLSYTLPVKANDILKYIDVCKKHFLSTMAVSDQVVYKALEKLNDSNGAIERDGRGHHKNHPCKITEGVIKSVCDHINSLQPVESHYTRKNSEKLYLDGDLNFHCLFEMYNDWLKDNEYEDKAGTERQYRDIVNKSFKLSFHVPKKDQCDQCHIHKNMANPTDEQINVYEAHMANKKICRELKNVDKHDSQSSQGKIVTATFDFQKVLNAPHGQLSILYYKRKLSVFNFTIFDVGGKEGYCYMWHEGEGKRGANEVSSCLYDFMKKMKEKGVNCDIYVEGNRIINQLCHGRGVSLFAPVGFPNI